MISYRESLIMKIFVTFILFSSLFIPGCQTEFAEVTHTTNKESMPVTGTNSSKSSNEVAQSFTGKVVYLSIEGGFWGIIADDHKQLDGSIPEQFQVEGLRVRGSYQILSDVYSFHMWGEVVNFIKLEKE